MDLYRFDSAISTLPDDNKHTIVRGNINTGETLVGRGINVSLELSNVIVSSDSPEYLTYCTYPGPWVTGLTQLAATWGLTQYDEYLVNKVTQGILADSIIRFLATKPENLIHGYAYTGATKNIGVTTPTVRLDDLNTRRLDAFNSGNTLPKTAIMSALVNQKINDEETKYMFVSALLPANEHIYIAMGDTEYNDYWNRRVTRIVHIEPSDQGVKTFKRADFELTNKAEIEDRSFITRSFLFYLEEFNPSIAMVFTSEFAPSDEERKRMFGKWRNPRTPYEEQLIEVPDDYNKLFNRLERERMFNLWQEVPNLVSKNINDYRFGVSARLVELEQAPVTVKLDEDASLQSEMDINEQLRSVATPVQKSPNLIMRVIRRLSDFNL